MLYILGGRFPHNMQSFCTVVFVGFLRPARGTYYVRTILSKDLIYTIRHLLAIEGKYDVVGTELLFEFQCLI